ncbi:hypothetical protein L0337_16040 [candidate division KSB1 bacterium]|nr:hypothetical protein [candidate division KSB1 bacterium]
MATKQEKMKIVQALEKRLRKKLPDMEVVLGKGYGTDVRVYVLSQKWRQTRLDPYALIRDALHDELSGDPAILKISFCWPMTPKEYEELKDTPYYVERHGQLYASRPNR